MMKTYRIDFYDKFKCIASECPYTCCKGWGLLVDDETYANMRKEKGLLGMKLRLFTRTDVENGAVLRTVCGRCPFLEKDGLCQLQKSGRKNLVADVCNLYPRRSISYGKICEVTLELSCVHAAELFLDEIKRHTFIERRTDENEIKPYYAVMNNDSDFLSHLMKDREKILDFLWENTDFQSEDGFTLFDKMGIILDYAYVKQNYFGRNEQDCARAVELPVGQQEIQKWQETGGFWRKTGETSGMVLPLAMQNELIYGRLSYTCTVKRNPVMYDLISKYKKLFGALYEYEAEGFWKEKWKELCTEHPDMPRTVLAYYSYLLQQTYCCAYETYYLIGPVILASVSTEFFMLFLVVAFLDGQTLKKEKIASIIAGMERAIRHSKAFEKEVLELFRNRK